MNAEKALKDLKEIRDDLAAYADATTADSDEPFDCPFFDCKIPHTDWFFIQGNIYNAYKSIKSVCYLLEKRINDEKEKQW